MLILCRHLVLVALFSPFLWNSSIFLAQFAPFDRCCYGFNFNIFLILDILILAKVEAIGHRVPKFHFYMQQL